MNENSAVDTIKQAFAESRAAVETQAAPTIGDPIIESISLPQEGVSDLGKQPSDGENTPEKSPHVQPEAPKQEAYSFKKIREENKRKQAETDRLARENELLHARMRDYEMRGMATNNQQQQKFENPEDSLPDDGIPDNKLIKLMTKQLREQSKIIEQMQQDTQQFKNRVELKADMHDFDDVVNEENLERLREEEPDVYEALDTSSNSLKAKKAAYKVIKKMILPPTSVPINDLEARSSRNDDAQRAQEIDKRKILENQQKPRSLSSINPSKAPSPLELAAQYGDVMTDAERAKWQTKMYDARRRTGL